MPLVYLCLYLLLGSIITGTLAEFLKDYHAAGKKRGYSVAAKWTPEFISLGICVAYVVVALKHLTSLNWEFVNQ